MIDHPFNGFGRVYLQSLSLERDSLCDEASGQRSEEQRRSLQPAAKTAKRYVT